MGNRRWLSRAARYCPVIVWMILISGLSTETFSADNTGGYILPILHWLLPSLSPGDLDRLHSGVQTDVFVLTLLYYSAVGYLFDSADLEFYLRKVKPEYSVPPTFQRVAPRGTDHRPVQGRLGIASYVRIMCGLLSSGYSVEYVNQVLEMDGQTGRARPLGGEQQVIIRRIDAFNEAIRQAARTGQHLHVVVSANTSIMTCSVARRRLPSATGSSPASGYAAAASPTCVPPVLNGPGARGQFGRPRFDAPCGAGSASSAC